MRHILKCVSCGKYTMKERCACGEKTTNPKPVKFSIDDRFASYKRKAKMETYAKKGLI